jgi:hypothetical protein
VATLVERTSRFLILVPLTGRDSLTVTQAIIAAVGGLPASITRSLTWDCGSEMALHKDVTATGLPVYFAHPHSPWERGSNENLNRIVREYLPKGVTITSDPNYLAAIAAEINDRPRKIHDWKSRAKYSPNSSKQMLPPPELAPQTALKPTANEKAGLIERRWWTAHELHACQDKLLPATLPALLDDVFANRLPDTPVSLTN